MLAIEGKYQKDDTEKNKRSLTQFRNTFIVVCNVLHMSIKQLAL